MFLVLKQIQFTEVSVSVNHMNGPMVGSCECGRGDIKLTDSLYSRNIQHRLVVSNANHIMLGKVYFISFIPFFK